MYETLDLGATTNTLAFYAHVKVQFHTLLQLWADNEMCMMYSLLFIYEYKMQCIKFEVKLCTNIPCIFPVNPQPSSLPLTTWRHVKGMYVFVTEAMFCFEISF